MNNVKKLRHYFGTQTNKPSSTFPPTDYDFERQVMRAKYQAAAWTIYLEAEPTKSIWYLESRRKWVEGKNEGIIENTKLCHTNSYNDDDCDADVMVA